MPPARANAPSQRQRRERRFIPPFGDGTSPHSLSNLLDRTFASCRFAPFPDRQLANEHTCFLDADEVGQPINPRFEIVVDDVEALTKALDCRADDLVVGLSVRNRHLRRYEALNQWDLSSLPSGAWSPPPPSIDTVQSGRDVDFVLALRVASNQRNLRSRGLGNGKVLSRKEFSVREQIDTVTFPFRWAEFGGSTGYPEELLWTIEWHDVGDSDDPYRLPVSEVLTVLVNKKAEVPLTLMNEAPGANDFAWRMLAAEVTTQIWVDVLVHTEEPPDENDRESLAGQVFARLARVSEKPYVEIMNLAGQDDSLSELRSWITQLFKVVE